MSKKANQQKRRTGKNKAKETFKKYGQYTNKHVRLKQQEFQNRTKNLNETIKKNSSNHKKDKFHKFKIKYKDKQKYNK